MILEKVRWNLDRRSDPSILRPLPFDRDGRSLEFASRASYGRRAKRGCTSESLDLAPGGGHPAVRSARLRRPLPQLCRQTLQYRP